MTLNFVAPPPPSLQATADTEGWFDQSDQSDSSPLITSLATTKEEGRAELFGGGGCGGEEGSACGCFGEKLEEH